jgi:hypothetical protein
LHLTLPATARLEFFVRQPRRFSRHYNASTAGYFESRYMFDNKHICIDDMRGNARSTGGWRRGLNAKYNDPRNGRSASLLETLSADLKYLTDEQWAELEPYFNSPAWSSSVSLVCRQVGFKHIDTVPEFIARLVSTLKSVAA